MVFRYAVVIPLMFLLSGGCTLGPGGNAAPDVRLFLLEPGPVEWPEAQLPETSCGNIMIAPPEPAPGFGSARMVYSRSPHELEYFAYHEWAAPPSELLSPLIGRMLRSTGIFEAVLPPGTWAENAYLLEIDSVRLVQLFPESESSRVELGLLARLYRRGELLSQRPFQVTEGAAERAPVAGVAAANRAAGRLLRQMGQWVVTRVGKSCERAGSAALGAQILFYGHDGGLHPGVDAELAKYRLDVELHGPVGNTQVPGNHLVALAFGQQAEDLHLTRGQFGEGGR